MFLIISLEIRNAATGHCHKQFCGRSETFSLNFGILMSFRAVMRDGWAWKWWNGKKDSPSWCPVLIFLWPQQTDSTALKTRELSWQNPESKSMSCSFHPGLAGFHQCKSKTSHWLLCWRKWVHFYIVSAQWSCLTRSEEHCQDADVNREKNFLKLPLLCHGGSSICSTQTTWMVWLQLSSFF